jgi:ubiquinone/menaquinone biosynthesis C-methylase UbiE
LSLGRRFDGVLFAYSLSMILDWAMALERAYEHLLPGGRLVVHDFGQFEGWGPFVAVMRGWLRLNHVETLRPYAEKVRELCDSFELYRWLGGYNFTAVGRRRKEA